MSSKTNPIQVAPSQSCPKKRMLGAEIRQQPYVLAPDAVIDTHRERRSVAEHKLGFILPITELLRLEIGYRLNLRPVPRVDHDGSMLQAFRLGVTADGMWGIEAVTPVSAEKLKARLQHHRWCSRTVEMKVLRSPSSSFGCSIAAKCPPIGMSVHRTMLYVFSA